MFRSLERIAVALEALVQMQQESRTAESESADGFLQILKDVNRRSEEMKVRAERHVEECRQAHQRLEAQLAVREQVN